MNGNRIPESYLRKLYGRDHWLFREHKESAPGVMPDALARFLQDQI